MAKASSSIIRLAFEEIMMRRIITVEKAEARMHIIMPRLTISIIEIAGADISRLMLRRSAISPYLMHTW